MNMRVISAVRLFKKNCMSAPSAGLLRNNISFGFLSLNTNLSTNLPNNIIFDPEEEVHLCDKHLLMTKIRDFKSFTSS